MKQKKKIEEKPHQVYTGLAAPFSFRRYLLDDQISVSGAERKFVLRFLFNKYLHKGTDVARVASLG